MEFGAFARAFQDGGRGIEPGLSPSEAALSLCFSGLKTLGARCYPQKRFLSITGVLIR